MNLALSEPLVTKTTLFVAKKPSTPVLHMGVMKEGQPVNVTCTSTGGRPPTQLKLIVANTTQTDVKHHNGTIKSVVSLDKMERQWNGKKVECCSQHVVYGRECVSEGIDYKFPPADVHLHSPGNNVTAIKETYSLDVTCSMLNFNAQCKTGLMIDGVNVSYGDSYSHGSVISNLSQIVKVSVSKADNGKRLECLVSCREFPEDDKKIKSKSWIISVPYHPEVTFDPAEDTIRLAEGDAFSVKCLVDSYPAANISWAREQDGAALVTKACEPGTTSCGLLLSLKPVTGNMTGAYICRAKNRLSANVTERRLHIVVNETKTKYSEKQSTDGEADTDGFLMPVVIGLVAFVVLVGVIIAVVVFRRRSSRKKESYSAANAVDENETNGAENVQLEETSSSTQQYNNIGANKDPAARTEEEQRNVYEKLDPEMKTDGLYEKVDTNDLSAGRTEEEKREEKVQQEETVSADKTDVEQPNVYEKLDPEMKTDGLYDKVETNDQHQQDHNGEEYINLNLKA